MRITSYIFLAMCLSGVLCIPVAAQLSPPAIEWTLVWPDSAVRDEAFVRQILEIDNGYILAGTGGYWQDRFVSRTWLGYLDNEGNLGAERYVRLIEDGFQGRGGIHFTLSGNRNLAALGNANSPEHEYSVNLLIIGADEIIGRLWYWLDDYALYISDICNAEDGYGLLFDALGHPPESFRSAFHVVRTDSVGEVLWTRTIAPFGIHWSKRILQVTWEGFFDGFLLMGRMVRDHIEVYPSELILVRLDADGEVLWLRSHFGLDEREFYPTDVVAVERDQMWAILETPNRVPELGSPKDLVIHWFDAQGRMAGVSERIQTPYSRGSFTFSRTTDDGFGVLYCKGDTMHLYRLDRDANLLYDSLYSTGGDIRRNRGIISTSDGGFAMWGVGPFPGYGEGFRSFVMKLAPEEWNAVTDDGGIGIPPYAMHLSAFPNPFNATLQLHYTLPRPGWWALRLYDSRGDEVMLLKEGFLPFGPHQLHFDAGALPSGQYMLALNGASGITTRRVVLMK
ncbi:MAG: hypothetical protein FJY67_09040 [Calditrichaeota bacterium]|nr:hypothetical protein [Calditrichota bacterium]